MKTTLYQQKFLVEEIQEATRVKGIQLLRTWLINYGYETSECEHVTVFRETGICTACGDRIGYVTHFAK